MEGVAPPTGEGDGVRWPERFRPDRAPVHVRDDLSMAAPPEVVWAHLVRAARWPAWYPNAANVTFLDGGGPDLTAGARFRWSTFGVTIVSTVREFEPCARIAWDGVSVGVDVYHAWLLRPSAQGSHVITEESQYGILSRLGALLMPGRMSRFHRIWLARLADNARAGLPPPA